MELIDIKNDIKQIMKKTLSESNCDEYIISNKTYTNMEVVYLFVIIHSKYGISYGALCELLDNYLTINGLCKYIYENGKIDGKNCYN